MIVNKKNRRMLIGVLGFLLILLLASLVADKPMEDKEMPLLLGLDKEAAIKSLEEFSDKFDFEIKLVEASSLEFEPGYVVMQEPLSGAKLTAGMSCILSISKEMSEEEIKLSAERENIIKGGNADSVSDLETPEVSGMEETVEQNQQIEGRYLGMMYALESPLEEREGGQVRLELIQDGERSVVFDEYLKSNEFPRYFEIEGKEEGLCVIEMFADDKKTEDTWTISMIFEFR